MAGTAPHHPELGDPPSGAAAPSAGADQEPTPRRSYHEAAHKLPQSRPSRWEAEDHDADEASEVLDEDETQQDVVAHAGRTVLALGALGVVYGDIGTSPLYAEQVTFGFRATQHITPVGVYGIVSLIFWSLAIVVSVKYAGFIMRAHNRGDGGIMALAALVRRNRLAHGALLVTLGIFGASLFFGDGMITPAISVLSAVSGLSVASPGVTHLIVPISVVILIGLFAIQRRGTGTVGWLFGPVMLVWFLSIALIGLPEVIKHPDVLQAVSPTWGARFFLDHGFEAFLTLGGVVLCVTGAEALYADRGHFGPAPIRRAWFVVVWPAVMLDYMGQAAWILDHPRAAAPGHYSSFNPFFSVVPSWFQLPEVVLATAATVIASQAVISGSYTVARQAMQLGYLPRLKVVHTSEMEGQIYVPIVNWILAGGVLALVLIFQSSTGLANAYGVAVTGTFVLNTVLFVSVARAMWHTPRWRLALLGGLFLTVEAAFFMANMAKLFHGAWLPLAVGFACSAVMLTWRSGQVIVSRNRIEQEGDLDVFLEALASARPAVVRVPGTAVFLNPTGATTPLALRSLVEHTHSVPQRLLIVSIASRSVPHVPRERLFSVKRIGPGRCPVLHLVVRTGYRDTTSIPALLQLARKLGYLERNLDLEGASYFISRMTITESDEPDLARWRKKLFLLMARNAASPIEHFGLPIERTVLMGSQVSL
ncbi:MAG TPA: KUP/HAK/KT family potassium transporter [Solirubrobacteraceae bacterium]|nr:KUP/HAK/KT family potassium transporter [Solirubrobacteraceae bacterium]